MKVIRIHGPSILEGCVNIQGSKNAALPMMAASVMNGGTTVLENCPDISDIRNSVHILNSIGCGTTLENRRLTINSSKNLSSYIPSDLAGRLRSSFLFSGALLSRCKNVVISLPGGCNIGSRPVDIHLDAFRKLGVVVSEKDNRIECTLNEIIPGDVYLRFPSVGATENIMLLCACSCGIVQIFNCACEPEIVDLQNMLNSMGADISGAGTPVIKINGVKKLKDVNYKIMPDRIVAATYLAAVACAGGNICLEGAVARHLSSYIALLRKCGMKIHICKDKIFGEKENRLSGNLIARTMPYPGFATDMQSLFMAIMSFSDGVSVIQENIFEDRFKLAGVLERMGADINLSGKTASIRGVNKLKGINAEASDLRSGAALLVAMLAAEGESELRGIHYIDRGYENLSENLISLGAQIERVEAE